MAARPRPGILEDDGIPGTPELSWQGRAVGLEDGEEEFRVIVGPTALRLSFTGCCVNPSNKEGNGAVLPLSFFNARRAFYYAAIPLTGVGFRPPRG